MAIDWPRIWQKRTLASYLLLPLSALYWLGWTSYSLIYSLGLKKSYRAKIPVVTVGNLRVGGSGKTPATIHIVELLGALGFTPAISLSGYGFPASESATLAPPGELPVEHWGDEAMLFRQALPEVPLIVGRDRVAAAKLAESAGVAVLVMDDGFQHLRLNQRIAIVLDEPSGDNRLCLPAGPYREPRGLGYGRAAAIIPQDFQIKRDFGWLQGDARPGKVSIVTAIAKPEALIARLIKEGFVIEIAISKEDHNPLDAKDLLDALPTEIPIVTTMKDWVKLRRRQDIDRWTFWVTDYHISIQPEGEFAAWLKKKLNER